MSPLCFVKGSPGEVPNCIQFYHNYKKKTDLTILTIAWSSGFIQNFPITESANPGCPPDQSKYSGGLSNTFSINDDLQGSFYSSFSVLE